MYALSISSLEYWPHFEVWVEGPHFLFTNRKFASFDFHVPCQRPSVSVTICPILLWALSDCSWFPPALWNDYQGPATSSKFRGEPLITHSSLSHIASLTHPIESSNSARHLCCGRLIHSKFRFLLSKLWFSGSVAYSLLEGRSIPASVVLFASLVYLITNLSIELSFSAQLIAHTRGYFEGVHVGEEQFNWGSLNYSEILSREFPELYWCCYYYV